MAGKGYERFTDDEEDNDWAVESSQSPAGLQDGRTAEPELDGQDLSLNLNVNNTEEQTGFTGDNTVGDAGGGEGYTGAGGNDGSTTETRSPRWTYAAFYQWIMSNAVMLYTSQLLSAWGDRMWSFAVALYLVEIEEQSLRLTAIYGLCLSGSSLIFGAAIGKWVDKTPRLRAARTSLIIQNSCVLINACLLCTVLTLKTDILQIWNGGLYIICQLIVILLGTLASLASLAEKICIQKDWVVVVAGGDKEVLAGLNANMRRIDLVSNILAPIAVGAIMTASMLIGGIFVAAWNGVSMVIEYWNLWRVYKNVPALAFKGGVGCTDEPHPEQEVTSQYSEMGELATEAANESGTATRNTNDEQEFSEVPTSPPSSESPSSSSPPSPPESPVPMATRNGDDERDFMEVPVTPTPAECEPAMSVTTAVKVKGDCCRRLSDKLKEMFEGWKVYKSYEEFWAGLGLAFLYMTVLGFDSITIGYGYSQGMPEYAMGVLQALGSITGILGTVFYPIMRKRIGLERTGLYSLWIQITFLMLCLGSLWAPGSPFIYDYSNSTTGVEISSPSPPMTSPLFPVGSMAVPTTDVGTTPVPDVSRVQCKYTGSDEQQSSLTSAIIMFSGIVLSRIGLWSYDLVVTQLVQEHVVETERGVFNGVQRALECSFDMLHFILVIALPCPETYGYLVILSIVFIITGACSYMVYSYKRRGHLIHMEKITPCLKNGHV